MPDAAKASTSLPKPGSHLSWPPFHWFGVVVASLLIGIANCTIYYATIDYMVATYGPYSASATGGNGFMRDVLAGMCPLYTGPMYKTLSIWNSCLVLFGLGAIFCIPVYVFNSKGPQIRENSKFARKLEMKKDETLRPEGIELRECQTLPNKAGRPRTV
ncbi:MFS general substrate transporter [Stemphylium lycopersici]|uniref:MFS general substrate transporter n=1 Tax=Stemphylium lycopersici TaxID=183478 RepID=A0A364N0N9_STELY|nr:MFS general substrate transporter [Stemphylium lycopersici]